MGTAEYTEGICNDGAAILRDGEQLTISEILTELNKGEELKAKVATSDALVTQAIADGEKDCEDLREKLEKVTEERDNARFCSDRSGIDRRAAQQEAHNIENKRQALHAKLKHEISQHNITQGKCDDLRADNNDLKAQVAECMTMLDNVKYWDTCPDDYIERIEKLRAKAKTGRYEDLPDMQKDPML